MKIQLRSGSQLGSLLLNSLLTFTCITAMLWASVAVTPAQRRSAALLAPEAPTSGTFTNSAAITIPSSGAASLYPSPITVSGQTGTVQSLTVTLNGFSHTSPGDVDVLLVGPAGQKFILVSDAGSGVGAPSGQATVNVTETFSDAAASTIGNGDVKWAADNTSSSSKPVNYSTVQDAFAAPAPAGPYLTPAPGGADTLNSAFLGSAPNGTWNLYVVDDTGGDSGAIAGGWTLNLTTAAAAAATTTTVTSNLNPSQVGNSVTFTATVTSGSTVNNGTVTFTDGASTLCSNVAVNASGIATCTTAALAAGNRNITATYTPGAGFLGSSGSMVQQVTSVAGTQFTNPGAISIPDGTASPYPGQILVSGLSGTISSLTVKLSNVTHTAPADIDALLVGPGGQKFILVSDAGSGVGAPSGQATNNVTVTFSDAGAAVLPTGDTKWAADGTSITAKPTDYGAGDTFPAPAPAGPYADPGPAGAATLNGTFLGATPNGVWSLYINDDSGGDTGTIAGGWTLDITSAAGPAATTTTVSTSGSPSAAGSPVTFTATVTSGSTVNNGTVTFTDGATTLCSNVAVVAGSAQCTTSALAGGNRTITATYTPGAGFLGSSGTVLQQVTTKTFNRFSNVGSITIPANGASSPYPSQILVSNTGTSIASIGVTLNNFSHTSPADVDILLVGPTGQKFILVSDAGSGLGSGGGGVATNNVTVTFRDNAAAVLATGNTQWGADNSTFAAKPTDYGTGDTFPAPAPAGPYADPGPAGAATLNGTFTGTNPNGVWSLYVFDDTGGDSGAIAGGWSLNIVTPTAADVSVSGRVVSATGTAIRGATVVLDDGTGHPFTVTTNAFGYYTASVAVGTTYMLNAAARGYVFTPRVITANDTLTDVDLVASP